MVEKKEKHNIIENAQLMSEWNWERNTDTPTACEIATTASGCN